MNQKKRFLSSGFSHEINRLFSALSVLSMAKSSAENHQPLSKSYIHEPNCNPIRHFIVTLLKCNNLEQIRRVHVQITVSGMLHNLIVVNKLLYLYAHSRSLPDAHALFGVIRERDAVTWSVMIGGFAKVRDYFNCFSTFKEYIRSGFVPDNYTLPSVIRACRDDKHLGFGKLIHQIAFKFGINLDEFVLAALVDMYANCEVIEDARQLFDKMTNRDLTTWTVLVSALAKNGNPSESLVLFDRMIDEGIELDKVAMATVVNACAKTGAMNKAKHVHDYIIWRNFSLDVILGSALIDMYAKCGNVDYAREIFDNRMNRRNVITWTTMIAAYGYHGRGKEALDLFSLMLRSGVSPNEITFVSLLYACSHGGLVEEGLSIFDSMSEDFNLTRDVKHYTCMVDLLGRAGRVSEAFNLVEEMTIEKDEGLFFALLGACRIHGEVELAEKVVESLVQFESRNPSYYVLLSNIYARAGKWEEMAKIREVMARLKLKKVPGWAWVEVDNAIYRFGVGDRTHVESKLIYEKLAILVEKVELVGYVPNTDFVLHDVEEEVKVEMLFAHSEKLAIAFGLLNVKEGSPIRITKNLRVCGDCHTFCKFVSRVERRVIVLRDAKRFHHFREGVCSCGDYW